MAKQLEMMYEGKAKQVFATDDPTLAVIHYKDDATAFNGLKKGTIVGKGVVNNLVSNHLFKMLEANGVKTHLVEQLNERDSVVRRVSIVPIEVIVRNIAAGSLSKRLGLPEGTKLKTTVLEYCYKNDDLGDPMINDYHIAAMELATKDEMAQIAAMALKVNELLTAYPADTKPAAPKPLTGKYAKLRDDLRKVYEIGKAAAAQVEDGGACNLDAPSLLLPRWQSAKIEQACKEAGCGCFEWKCFNRRWVICFHIPGQAYKRETAAEVMTKALADMGYDALTYCAID